MANRKSRPLIGIVVFVVMAVATWFVVPPQPVRIEPARVLSPSREPNRRFIAMLPGGRWALTARIEDRKDTTGHYQNTPIRLYDLSAGRETLEVVSELVSGDDAVGEVQQLRTVLSPDGTLLTVSLDDRTPTTPLYVWDLTSGKRLAILPVVTSWSVTDSDVSWYSPDSQFLAYCSTERLPNEIGDVRVWNRAENGHGAQVPRGDDPVAISPDSKRIVVEVWKEEDDSPSHLGIYDLRTGMEEARLPIDREVASLTWTPDGRYVAIADLPDTGLVSNDYATIRVTQWNIETGTRDVLLTAKEQLNAAIVGMQFSANGRYLALSTVWHGSSVWDTASTPPVLIGNTPRNLQPEFSAERQVVIIGEPHSPPKLRPSSTLRLWRLGTPIEQATVLLKDESNINNVEFISKGDRIAISYFSRERDTGIVQIWETATGLMSSTFSDVSWAGSSTSPAFEARWFAADGNSFFDCPRSAGQGVHFAPWDAASVQQWDVVDGPSWKWLVGLWIAEAGLTALGAFLIRRRTVGAFWPEKLESIHEDESGK